MIFIAVLTFGQDESNSKSVAAKGKSSSPASATQSSPATPADELKAVLEKINQSSLRFQTLQADVEWEYFDKLIKESDVQKRRACFRRKGSDVQAVLNFNVLSAGKQTLTKQILYRDGVLSIYEPKINRITEPEVGKYKSDLDASMSLGFGGLGDELATSFTVKWLGWETIDGIKAAKLEVTGKSAGMQKAFSRALLWIDPERDIALQQQFYLGSSGDYRLVRYRNIKFNDKMSDSTFRLKTTGKPEIVRMNAH